MQFWHCPLMLMVSLIAAINTEQTPSQRLEPNQGLVEQQGQPQQMQEQPSQADNKDYHHMPSPAILLQLTPSDWKNTEEKRNWNRMQGMWGKRSQQQQQQQQFDDVTDDTVPQRLAKRAWKDLTQQGWGKRSWAQLHGAWGKRKWDQLHGAWGKRTPFDADVDVEDEDYVQQSQQPDQPFDDSESQEIDNNKRSGWNKMQGVWGKRSSSPISSQNDLLLMADDDGQLFLRDGDQVDKTIQDGDGSAEMVNKRAWNQMQSAWGKRALSAMAAGYKRNWNNLRGAWGKREMPAAVAKGMEWSRKRESGWNNLKGLWG